MRRWPITILAFFLVVGASREARAYRPFDGTDADVAEQNELELELGPAGYLKEGGEHLLVAPRYVINYGIAPDTELVLGGRGLLSLDDPTHEGVGRYTHEDGEAFVKNVLRRGVLQGGTGPSVALEAGALLPTVGREQGVGTSAGTIVSFRNAYGTLHLNGVFQLTRERHNRDLFVGAILEGPIDLRVRPVLELFWDRDFGAETRLSALGGAIWTVTDDIAVDAAFRLARIDTETGFELRGGLTWTVPVF
jgi:hypothetical protein